MSDYETCTISTGADAPRNDPKNDPKRKGKKKLSNLSDDQFEWVKSQTSQFSGKDSDIYAPPDIESSIESYTRKFTKTK